MSATSSYGPAVRGLGTPCGTAAIERLLGPLGEGCRPSASRFPDGAQMRIEIPSVEGPEALAAVLDEAAARGVTVHRVSQGSGAMLLTRAELSEMARMGADAGLEVNLFVGPREEFGVGSAVRSPEGGQFAGRLRGLDQLRYAVEDIYRAVEAGIRGFLIADLGLMEVLASLVVKEELPSGIVWKISAVLAPSNPVTFRQLVDAGGTTINVPTDMTLDQLCELRSVSDAPIDLYVEAPDALGGVVRGHELTEIALAAAPLYAKFGLRNARAVYPAGIQVQADVVANVREKVRRSQLALEWLDRSGVEISRSAPSAPGIGVPCP